MTTARIEPDSAAAARTAPAAISAALAVMALVAANRSTKDRSARVREGRDTPHTLGHDRRETPRDAPAAHEPAATPAPRRLPTGLY
jgi:hypothetical protein